jgi:hypothetical protein
VFPLGYLRTWLGYARPPVSAQLILISRIPDPSKVIMRHNLRTYARQLLHAIAEAGSLPPAQELQPLLGPNGALVWTEVAPIRRGHPNSDDWLPTSESFAVPTTSQPRKEIRRPELVGKSLEAPAV